MVYDWDNKEDICYRMYIEEKKSLEDIMEFMKVNHNFAPRYVIDLRTPATTASTTSTAPATVHHNGAV